MNKYLHMHTSIAALVTVLIMTLCACSDGGRVSTLGKVYQISLPSSAKVVSYDAVGEVIEAKIDITAEECKSINPQKNGYSAWEKMKKNQSIGGRVLLVESNGVDGKIFCEMKSKKWNYFLVYDVANHMLYMIGM